MPPLLSIICGLRTVSINKCMSFCKLILSSSDSFDDTLDCGTYHSGGPCGSPENQAIVTGQPSEKMEWMEKHPGLGVSSQ